MMNNFDYIRATDGAHALQQLAAGTQAAYIAGGTNIIDLLRYNLATAGTLVDINELNEHSQVAALPGGGLRLGALVTNAATACHPTVEQQYPLLSKAILAGASAQIRNMATNGGNMLQRTRCYYFYDASAPCNKRVPGSGCGALTGYNRIMAILGTSEHCIAVYPSDMSIALAALNASVNTLLPDGQTRTIPFTDFHRLPANTPHLDDNLQHGELITSIDLPAKGFANNYSYLKLRDRNSYAFALVSVATALELDGDVIQEARIVLGGVAHKPWRVPEAEDYLKNKAATRENFAAAAAIILQGAKGYGHNDFKIELAKRAIVRNGLMALNPQSQLPGAKPSA